MTEKKMAKRLETEVRVEVDGLFIRDFLKMSSDVEFLSGIETEGLDSSKESYRYIRVSGGPKLYSLKYSVEMHFLTLTDYPMSGDKDLAIIGSKKYTHAQVRDMRSAAKKKSS